MIDNSDIKRAFTIHAYVYQLVPWLENAITRNAVRANEVALLSSDSGLCLNWFKSQYQNLPTVNRPTNNSDELTDYANMLSGMLFDAFEVEQSPGNRYVPHRLRTFHEPSKTARNPHLHPKKLTKKDKARAKKLKLSYLEQLGKENDLVIPQETSILETPSTNKALAIATYAACLVKRMKGHKEGPAVLVLYREFAWHDKGGPIKNFKLKHPRVAKAMKALKQALQ